MGKAAARRKKMRCTTSTKGRSTTTSPRKATTSARPTKTGARNKKKKPPANLRFRIEAASADDFVLRFDGKSGSSQKKDAVYNKYKGKINNYLSAQGHNVSQAYKDWGAKQKEKAAGKSPIQD